MHTATLNTWRLSSVMATAVTMCAAGAHAMELRSKMKYEPRLYVRLHRTLYEDFGGIAGPAEALAVLTTGTLAWWSIRQHRADSSWTAAAALGLAAAHGVYWAVVQPVNVEMARWPPDAIPGGWKGWRDRWEYGHAVRAGLVAFSLGALAWSLMDAS